MSKKDNLFFLQQEDGRVLYEDSAGNISSSVQPNPLVHAPDGNEDIAIGYTRDFKKKGIITSVPFPFKFVNEGAKILRKFCYTPILGMESKLFIGITRRIFDYTDTTFRDYHKKLFRGEIDLSEMSDETDGDSDYIQAATTQTGLAKSVKAHENTEFEFLLSDKEAINIDADGMPMQQTANFIVTERETNIHDDFQPDAGYASSDGQAVGFAGFTQFFDFPPNPATSTNYLFVTDQPITGMKMKGEFIIENNIAPNGYPNFFRAKLRRSGGAEIDVTSLVNFDNVFQKKTIPFDLTFNGGAGEKFFLVFYTDGFVKIRESRFTVTFSSTYRSTKIRAFNPDILGDKILERIHGARGLFSSSILSGPFKGYALTSGDGVRGIETAAIKISLRQFMDIYSVNCNAGESVESEKYVVEDIEHYFPANVTPIDLGEVMSLKASFAKDLMGNTFEVGHKNKSTDEVNGKYAFNTVHKWAVPGAQRVPKKLDFVSPAICDPYAIEHTRINFDGKKTTDNDKDNDIFLLHVDTDAPADDNAIATVNALQAYSGAQLINFSTFNNFQFTPNVGNSQFTYNGVDESVDLQATILADLPDGTPGGGQATARFKVNGVVVAELNMPYNNGSNFYTIVQTYAIKAGDVVSLEIEPVSVTNWTTNNISFLIEFNSTKSFPFYREAFDTVTGIPAAGTAFNVDLSPKRVFYRLQKWINSLFFYNVGQQYIHNGSDRNSDLETVHNGVTITEKANEVITTDKYFIPLYFSVQVEALIDLVDTVELTPYHPFIFTFEEVFYRGFLANGGVACSDEKPQVFKLLSHPDNDLSRLIR